MQVLVVEDEFIIGEHICAQLVDLGYQARGPLPSGEEAVELCRREPPDMVLMDIRLGGSLDGVDAARVISLDLHIPVIYLTAYSDDETLERAKATHPHGYLLKPSTDGHLRATLEVAYSSFLVERGIRESEARYRTAVEGLPDGVWVVDRHGTIVLANEALGRMLNRKQTELHGRALDEFLAEESREVYRERLERGHDGDSFELTLAPQPEEGEAARATTVLVSFRSVGEKAMPPGGFCGVCVDISRLREDHARLSAAEQTFSQVFQAIPDASIVVRSDERTVIDANEAFLSMTGYTRDDVVGHNLMMLANWNDLNDLNSFLALLESDSGVAEASAVRCKNHGILPVKCLVRNLDSGSEAHRLLVMRRLEE
jgi:PAS domain S-box-containing protein